MRIVKSWRPLRALGLLTALLTSSSATHAQSAFVPTTAMERLVYECAVTAGVDVTGKRPMTPKEVRDTTRCVELARAALARMK
jgi:hypothetical protein